MISKVDAIPEQGSTLSLTLQDITNGYMIKDITGLDPVKATIVSSNFASMDGEQFQSSRRDKRNIVIKLGLRSEYTTSGNVRDLRSQLYKIFMPKSTVRLRFFDEWMDMEYVEISGMVESFESSLFVKEPEVTISLICFDSDFYAPEPRAAHGDSTAMATQTLVPYDGDIETGIRFIMNVNRSLPNFVLHHRAGSTSAPERDMIFNTALSSGDVIEIQTYAGDKHVTLTRGGVTTSILYGLDPASIWTELVPGNNYIRVSSSGAPISYTIEFTERYGGL